MQDSEESGVKRFRRGREGGKNLLVLEAERVTWEKWEKIPE